MGNKKVVTVTQEEFHDDPGAAMKKAGDNDLAIVDEEGNTRAYMGSVSITRWDFTPFTREEYDRLVNELQNDPKVRRASYTDMVLDHPAYLDMVDAGEDALPFIFEGLEADTVFHLWSFPAIQAILGEGPEIPDEVRGKVDKMRKIYVQWGKDLGYL